MKSVTVRSVTIGQGRPKICVPIVNKERVSILAEAMTFIDMPMDVVEWRADWYEHGKDIDKVLETAKMLRDVLKNIPILFTYRTPREGGASPITAQEYEALNIAVAESRLADLIDVEMFSGDEMVTRVINAAHKNKVKVVGSNHDFYKTPEKEEIVKRLRKMQELGADIPKIAVTPLTKADVLELLEATVEMEQYANRPIVTMSMGGLGVVSRISGEIFGSAMTFGAAAKASAPGQLDLRDLESILNVIHKSQE
ncbi:MAG: type I 3-dehydroquinate dehydratase [Brotaphodocola sp.]